MSSVDFHFINSLLSQNMIIETEIRPETQHLRKYHGNVMMTFYGSFNTYLAEVKYDKRTNTIAAPDVLILPYTCTGTQCCFNNPKVCGNKPSCVFGGRNDGSKFCQTYNRFCKDQYNQYKYVCNTISENNGDIISRSRLQEMTNEDIYAFIKEAKECHDARKSQLDYCSNYGVQKHKGIMVVIETRIRQAYEELITRRMNLDLRDDKLIINNIINSIDTDTLVDEIYKKGVPFYIDLKLWFSRKHLEYLYIIVSNYEDFEY